MTKAYANLSDEQKELIKSFHKQKVLMQDLEPPVIHKAVQIEEPADMLKLTAVRSTDLLKMKYKRLSQPVQGLITEGLTLLVGASKIGKSWLVLSMCLAVANGTEFLGHLTEQGVVLYMALEDSGRRLQSRLSKLTGASENLFFCTNALTLSCGMEKQLTNWFNDHRDTKLIVIDTLQMIRGGQQAVKDAYQNDYATMQKLKVIADENHASIVLVHHTNKQKNVEDNFDKISGSTGLMGAADTTILIDRDRRSKQATVGVVGRDVYCDDFIIEFDGSEWRMVSHCAQQYDEEQAYINNPVTQTIRCLITQNPNGLRISYDELRSAGMKLLGFAPFIESKDFLNKLHEIEEQLLFRDNIICTTSVYVKRKRGIKLEIRQPLTDFQTGIKV